MGVTLFVIYWLLNIFYLLNLAIDRQATFTAPWKAWHCTLVQWYLSVNWAVKLLMSLALGGVRITTMTIRHPGTFDLSFIQLLNKWTSQCYWAAATNSIMTMTNNLCYTVRAETLPPRWTKNFPQQLKECWQPPQSRGATPGNPNSWRDVTWHGMTYKVFIILQHLECSARQCDFISYTLQWFLLNNNVKHDVGDTRFWLIYIQL